MPSWTSEQNQAINTVGSNIIVSAGAGSGKTAVLTQRVITHLQKGIKINELLILTFTNAAAGEMQDRIRTAIEKDESIKNNLDLLASSYITTFDSFTLSLVRKYHYLLNVSDNFSIVDSGFITLKKEEILDKIFDKYYESDNLFFNKLIDDFCIKNDKNLKTSILKIINSIDLKSDKKTYLDSYLDNYLSEDNINNYLNEYIEIINNIKEDIYNNLLIISDSDYYEYYDSLSKSLDKLLKCKTYEEYKENIDVNIPRKPNGSDDIKPYKTNIDNDLKEIKNYLRFSSIEDIKYSFKITKDYIHVIIDIIKDFYKEINLYKNNNNIYEFIDIEIMAINLLKNNHNICDEVKNYYTEIMVDEYQDTSDLQEEFISLIANNNVYMVGDIKQSIYGFRNANPLIFKNKYDNYSKNINGIKIDLVKNFRSREEVIEIINMIFSLVMDNDIGGADYKKTHQMVFGNTSYTENKANQNYDLEVLCYEDDDEFSKEEIESFIIGKDIQNKIKNKYQVLDKITHTLRDCRYEDFCIIMDRGGSFTTYKKVFEYLHLPLDIYEDKKLTSSVDIMIINNILGLLIKLKNNEIDKEFKYFFMSVGRSYLFEYSDQELFDYLTNNSYEDSNLYKLLKELLPLLDNLSISEIICEIIKKFNIYENIIKIGNVQDTIIKLDNIVNIAMSLEKLGYTIEDLFKYINQMIDSGKEITYKDNLIALDAIKIMNIHKSKGLEFPICYFSGLYKEFNTIDIKERFLYDSTYGIVTPYFNEGIGTSILKDLVKNKYNVNNVSERIRLFYVALTRAKEKIIFVSPLKESITYNSLIPSETRLHFNSFLSIIKAINLSKYSKIVKPNLTKEYLYNIKKDVDNEYTTNLIKYEQVNIDTHINLEKHASKIINNLVTKEQHDTLEFGTYMHELFEKVDFLNVPKDYPHYEQIKNFVNKFNINSNTKIYKEHEFIYEDNDIIYHGIIDLVLINDNKISIIDYKLKNIDDNKYIDQLNVYYNYMHLIYPDNQINMYLYSITTNSIKNVK